MKIIVILFFVIFVFFTNFLLFAEEYWVPYIDSTPGPTNIFSGIIIMAICNETKVDIDVNHDGIADFKFLLQRGERKEFQIPNLMKGTHIFTSTPVSIYYQYFFDDITTSEDSEYRYMIPPIQRLGLDYWIPAPLRLISILGLKHYTTISLDMDANGIIDQTINLNRGETWELDNITSNLHITGSDTIMVVALNFDEKRYGNTYAYTALPVAHLGDTYYLPRVPRYKLNDGTDLSQLKIMGVQDTTIILIKDQIFRLKKGQVLCYPTIDTLLIRSNNPVFPVYISDMQAQDPHTSDYRHYSHAFPCYPDFYAPNRAMKFLIDHGLKANDQWPEQILAITSFEDDNKIEFDAKLDNVIEKAYFVQKGETIYIYNGEIPGWDEKSLLEITSTHKIQVVYFHQNWWQGSTEKISSMLVNPLGIKGDANFDGIVDSLDIEGIKEIFLHAKTVDALKFWIADLNDDQNIDVGDILNSVSLSFQPLLAVKTHDILFHYFKEAFFEIRNKGKASAGWKISKIPHKSWLISISPDSAKDDTTVRISVDPSKLNSRIDSCWLFINSNGGRDFVQVTITKSSADRWQVPITISSGTQTFIRTFGASITATDLFDNGLDVVTAPPGLDFYPYFELATFPYFLDTDLRKWKKGQNSDKEWHLNIKNVRQPATLKWSANDLPTEGSCIMSGTNFLLDMHTHQSTLINTDEIIKIQYSEMIDFTFDFPTEGWYLISLPVIPQDSSLKVLFPDALAAFESVDKSYVNVEKLIPGKGYWLLIPKPMKVTIKGLPFKYYKKSYEPGWCLIGSITDTVAFSNPKDKPDSSIIACYGWDKFLKKYYLVYPNGTEKLLPGDGYWIAVLKPCTLEIGKTSFMDMPRIVPLPQDFFVKYGILPPLPPEVSLVSDLTFLSVDNLAIQNYPNPFNCSTQLIYSLPKTGYTRIFIFNTLGQTVKNLLNSSQSKGIHQTSWDGTDDNGLPAGNGLYLCRIEQLGQVKIQKMVVLK